MIIYVNCFKEKVENRRKSQGIEWQAFRGGIRWACIDTAVPLPISGWSVQFGRIEARLRKYDKMRGQVRVW